MSSRPTRYRRRRPPFLFLAFLAKDELDAIDGFVEFTREARISRKRRLERQAAGHAPDKDYLVHAYAQLDGFAALSAEFAIIGLWRCVELSKATAIRTERAFARAAGILPVGIPRRVRCARSVNELRCLNNAIKHGGRVNGDLADFPRWRGKKGRKLGNLEGHYARLRSAADRYVRDLAGRLSRRTPL